MARRTGSGDFAHYVEPKDQNQVLWATGAETPRYSGGSVFALLALRHGFAARRSWGDVPVPPPQYPTDMAATESFEYVLL